MWSATERGFVIKIFETRHAHYLKIKQQLETTHRQLVNLRGALALSAIILAFVLSPWFWWVILLSLFPFSWVVYRHLKNRQALALITAKIHINDKQRSRLAGTWTSFSDTGASKASHKSHPYLIDLDILGEQSLYQYLSDTQTHYGKTFLRDMLLQKTDLSTLKDRQLAIAELVQNLEFCEALKALGHLGTGLDHDPEPLIQFLETKERMFRPVRYAFALTLLLLSLPLFHMLWPNPFWLWGFLGGIVAQGGLFVAYLGKTSKILGLLGGFHRSLKQLQPMISLIQTQTFHAPLNKQLQGFFKETQDPLVFLKALNRIETAISFRRSGTFFLVLNLVLLWDINCVLSLEELKAQGSIRKWLRTLGMFEALASLANVAQLHPHWALPIFTDDLALEMKDLAHPLLTQPVTNDYTQKGLTIITGSNMSGKTTFLRAIGTNLVLAYAGAVVSASHFKVPLMDIYTCMRTVDNLQENMSTFYAELTRLKTIIDRGKTREPLLFLVDEIFRGTNSEDRITGAKQVLYQLNKPWILGMLTTHDLAICEVRDDKRPFHNHHFKEYYEDNQLRFDYQVREGISTTRNAKHLMELVGIKTK